MNSSQDNIKIRVRFAPSPTGDLHLGNIRLALINYFYSKKNSGEFILRFDDSDQERSLKKYEDSILEDLSWCLIDIDKIYHQSDRLAIYEKYANKLKAENRLYACYETPAELQLMRRAMISKNEAPRYNRQALKLTSDQKKKYHIEGRLPHWRFLLSDDDHEWIDGLRGKMKIAKGIASDPVLIRQDNIPLYTFNSVVDDIEMNISDIIRGEDHISNTAIQLDIFKALKAKLPNFSHYPTLMDKNGKALSKRDNSLSIKTLKANGIEAKTIIQFLAFLGTNQSADGILDIKDIIDNFNMKNYSKSAPRLNMAEITSLNAKTISNYSYAEIKDKLKKNNKEENLELFWQTIKSNVTSFEDINKWQQAILKMPNNSNQFDDEDLKFISAIIPIISNIDWQQDNLAQNIFVEIKKHSDRKAAKLYLPIRLALTGQKNGPELDLLFNYFGKEGTLNRLQYAIK